MKTLFSLLTILITLSACGQSDINNAKGLALGEKAPLFSATTNDGSTFSLEDNLEKTHTVVIFYRGHWCPFCNRHLLALQDSLALIEKYNAQVIAISPEKPEYGTEMAEKTSVKFKLLYDEGYKIAKQFDVSFTPPKQKVLMYNTIMGASIGDAHSESEAPQLPIPATFIIDKNGVIVWRHFDPNYKERSSVRDIISVLSKQ